MSWGDAFLATTGEEREELNHELQQYVRDNYMFVDACDTQLGIAYNPDVIEHVNIMARWIRSTGGISLSNKKRLYISTKHNRAE